MARLLRGEGTWKLAPFPTREGGWGLGLTLLDSTEKRYNASQLVQQGVELYQAGDIPAAIAQCETALNIYRNSNNRQEIPIVLENLARGHQQIGQIDRAITYWTQVIAAYRQMGNQKQVGRMLTEQAQSYSSLGQNRRAIAILCNPSEKEKICAKDTALPIARQQNDRLGEAAAKGSLGNAYRNRGEYKEAISYLEESLAIANELANPIYRASTLNSLGLTYSRLAQVNYRRANSAEYRGDTIEAGKYKKQAVIYDTKLLQLFQQSIEIASDFPGKMRGLVNSIPLLYRTQDHSSAANAEEQARSLTKRTQ